MKTIEQRTKIPAVGTRDWEKAVLAAIKSGKVKFSAPKRTEFSETRKLANAQRFLQGVLA